MKLNGTEYINDTIFMKAGTIFFEIIANDTFNNIFTSTLHFGGVINKAPSAGNLTIFPLSVTSNDTLTLNYDFFDIDDDLESGTEIRWYNNSVLQSSYNDVTTIPTSALIKGHEWYATVKPKDGTLFGDMVNSSFITIENTQPQISNVIITPSNPVNTSVLTASYDYSDIDSDSENTGNREIFWYKKGVLENSYNNMLTVPNSASTKGETWNYRIRVHDGINHSIWVNSTSVTIVNSAPTASGIEILNSLPTTADDLLANWTFNDLDLDSEDPNWIIFWYKNDILQNNLNNSKTVLFGNTTKNDIWYFELQVFDGMNYSILYQSATVQVINTAPSATDISITQNPTTTNQLVASWTFTDIDVGDTQSAIKNITWYKNHVHQPSSDNQTTVDSSTTTKGEVWYYLFQVYDGEAFSIVYNSSNTGASTTILNTAPTTSNEAIINQNPVTTDHLVASWDEDDDDGIGDIETGVWDITWYKNGVLEATYDNKTQVNSTDTLKGEIWNFIIQIHDGEAFSLAVNSTPVTILNSKPTATDRKYNTTVVATDEDFNINYTYSDIDGDFEVIANLIVFWFINGSYNPLFDNYSTIYSSNTTEGSFFYYIIKVFDGSEYSNNLTSDEAMVIGIGSNTPPEVFNLTVDPIIANTIVNLLANYTYFDDDGHPEAGSQIRWYKNSTLQLHLNDTKIVPFSETNKGENWYFTVRPKDGQKFGDNYTSSNITIINSAPTASDLFITQNPATTSNILISWNYVDIDGDSESLQFNITWYRNGFPIFAYNNKTQVNASDTAKNDLWHFILQVYDSDNYSISYNSSALGVSTTIINTAPTAGNLRFENIVPRTTHDLVANWTFSDLDNDNEDFRWKTFWYKSSELQVDLNDSRTILSENTTKNQVWYFELQVFDGTNYSIMYRSSNIQIFNSAPSLSNIGITTSPKTSDDLVATWMFNDADGDSPSVLLNITWYKNGLLQPSYINITTVSSSVTTKGEVWYFIVQVYDGESSSILYNSSNYGATTVILNTIPVASEVTITKQNPYTTDDLVSDWTFYDADGDSQNAIINITWYKNGQHEISNNNLTVLTSNTTLKGEQWYFTLQVFDGEGFSLASNSSIVTILNSAPILVTTPTFNKTIGITTTNDLEIRYNYTDADNDSIVFANLSVKWFLLLSEQPLKANQTILFSSDTVKGQFWSYEIQVYDGEAYSIVYSSILIEIVNSAPQIQGPLVLNPDFPVPGDSIVLSYTWFDNDISDIEKDTEIRWYRNGTLQHSFNDSSDIDGSSITKGYLWNITVRVSDGSDFGDLIFITFFIGNTRPEIVTSGLGATIAYTTTNLIANNSFSQLLTFYDADSEPIVWIEYRWFVNNVENSTYYNQAVIPASETTKGEEWRFSLQISDGVNTSDLFYSLPVVIQNSSPVVNNVVISSSYNILYTNNSLDLSWNYSDADFDPEVFSEMKITWLRNGIEQISLENLTSIPSSSVTKGDFWIVRVEVFDGTTYSSMIELEPVESS
ncbi:MAG: hypothetical protein ACW99A_14625 [Candidatus Kariarchaeaceae archaeon]|jgi:hypothetical protein